MPQFRFLGVVLLLADFCAAVCGIVGLGIEMCLLVRMGEGVGELLGSNIPIGLFVGVTVWSARRLLTLFQPRFVTSSASEGIWLSSSAWLDSEEERVDIFVAGEIWRTLSSVVFMGEAERIGGGGVDVELDFAYKVLSLVEAVYGRRTFVISVASSQQVRLESLP
jgi:hypothetical protein